MRSINPANNQVIREYAEHSGEEVSQIIESVNQTWLSWKETSFEYRGDLFRKAAHLLRNRKAELAKLMTLEMGKIIKESEAEIEKCALVCDFYAEKAAGMLADEFIPSDAGKSFVTFQPLGVILAVMPWNFPFWQVFRFAAPTLMAGNSAVLKHASNVPGCALAIENIFIDADFPPDLFRCLMIPSTQVEAVITHPLIKAVSLTGSEAAGSQVASLAGKNIKKSLLELGGSDPFIILEDSDLETAVRTAVTARMINQGQSCIAAKRFIVVEKVADEFITCIKILMAGLKMGDPMEPGTQVSPLARPDLVDDIEKQVHESIAAGAKLVLGGKRPDRTGCYFEPTILDRVSEGMAVYRQETFGPVMAVIRVANEEEAIAVANDTEFGLGGCIWTRDLVRGEAIARKINTGAMFVNGMTKSDPRLPFGGINKSGYGRELGLYGIREFVNMKTVWIG